MKKNLLMLLCAVSLLGTSVQADPTAAEAPGYWQRTKNFFSDGYNTAKTGVTDGYNATTDYLKGAYETDQPLMARKPWIGHDTTEGNWFPHLTGRAAYGLSHAGRAANLGLFADSMGRGSNSLVGRGFARLGGLAGIRTGAAGIRGRIAGILANSPWLQRLALVAPHLAVDAILARMVDESSVVGASYRGVKDGTMNLWNRMFGKGSSVADKGHPKFDKRGLRPYEVDTSDLYASEGDRLTDAILGQGEKNLKHTAQSLTDIEGIRGKRPERADTDGVDAEAAKRDAEVFEAIKARKTWDAGTNAWK